MKAVFADTSYFGALLSPKDEAHEKALAWSGTSLRPMVTTEFVLTELGNACSSAGARRGFSLLLEEVVADVGTTVVAASTDLFHRGLNLFLDRTDKEWSLTDCISFMVMEDQGITEALTADHHFEQAGFKALLKS